MRKLLILTAAALLGLAPSASAQVYPSYGDPMALVDSWYRTYLGRSAIGDPAAGSWVDLMRQGNSPQTIQASILSSEEYYNRAGGSMQGFIQAVFRDVVGRQPTPGEYDFWVRRGYTLDRKGIAYELLTHNPGGGIVVAPPPPAVIIPDRDRDRERDRDRDRERQRERERELQRERERHDHDYRRPDYPFRR